MSGYVPGKLGIHLMRDKDGKMGRRRKVLAAKFLPLWKSNRNEIEKQLG